MQYAKGLWKLQGMGVGRCPCTQHTDAAHTSTWVATREPAKATLQGLGDPLMSPTSPF